MNDERHTLRKQDKTRFTFVRFRIKNELSK